MNRWLHSALVSAASVHAYYLVTSCALSVRTSLSNAATEEIRIMLFPCLLVSVVAAMTCPSVTCASDTNSTCVMSHPAALQLSPCPAHSTCPLFSSYALNTTTCVPAQTHTPPTRQCLRYYEEQQLCDLNRPCNLQNYCHLPDGRCRKRQSIGSACTDLWECEAGTVCNKGICRAYFSLGVGELADSRIVCASAVVKKGVCAPEARSKTSLPVSCVTDDDCQATDHSYSTCTCPFSSQTSGVCTLHPSDEPVKKALVALHDGKVELASYLHKRITTYPRAEMAEKCMFSHDESLKNLKMLEEWSTRCLAVALEVVTALVLALI